MNGLKGSENSGTLQYVQVQLSLVSLSVIHSQTQALFLVQENKQT